jgi:hypothetical protein
MCKHAMRRYSDMVYRPRTSKAINVYLWRDDPSYEREAALAEDPVVFLAGFETLGSA